MSPSLHSIHVGIILVFNYIPSLPEETNWLDIEHQRFDVLPSSQFESFAIYMTVDSHVHVV